MHLQKLLACCLAALLPIPVWAQAQRQPAGAARAAQPTPARAAVAAPSQPAASAPAPGDNGAQGDAEQGDDNDVHHYHHHYFYPPYQPGQGPPPPYYNSQPTGQMNPSQQQYPPSQYMPPVGGGGGYGGGGWGWGGGGGGTTIAGSYMQGAGAMMQGAGQYNLLTAEAARQGEAARAEAMQNQMTYMNDYFLAREANRDYRRQLAGPPITEQEAYNINMSRLPKRLTLDEFDPATGKINWPDVLKRPEFDEDRQKLDNLFAKRTHADSGLGSPNYHNIQIATRDMMSKLHDDIKGLGPSEYLLGLKYIDGLQFESRFPPGTDPYAEKLSQNEPSPEATQQQ